MNEPVPDWGIALICFLVVVYVAYIFAALWFMWKVLVLFWGRDK